MTEKEKCLICGRLCKTQQQEDYKLCEYHLENKLRRNLFESISKISLK